jgi:hypothetical protein
MGDEQQRTSRFLRSMVLGSRPLSFLYPACEMGTPLCKDEVERRLKREESVEKEIERNVEGKLKNNLFRRVLWL